LGRTGKLWLDLGGCQGITDAAVEYLAKLKGLQRLWLTGTSVTPAGRDRLKAALPKCKIR
jgi:hypothetical protein